MNEELTAKQKRLDKEIIRLGKITKRKLKLINSNDSYQFIKQKYNHVVLNEHIFFIEWYNINILP